MTVLRAERFETDVERPFRWSLLETDLDPIDAIALATRFADAVDTALEVLRRNPQRGRTRFKIHAELSGTRSRRITKPFQRFLIFYRIEGENVSAERLLEGHSRLAAGE